MMSVYRNYSQDELNAQYSPRAAISEDAFQRHLQAYAELGTEARRRLSGALDERYGLSEAETVDVFPAGEGAPLVVLLHGGYWRMLSKNDFLFPALALVPQGIAVAGVNYGLAPAVSLREIVQQCRSALAWLHHQAPRFRYDGTRIVLVGHSAGAHLAAMMLCGLWASPLHFPEAALTGAVLVSGLYDLEPVRLGPAQEWLKLTPQDVADLSPIRQTPSAACPVVVSYGERESDEFKRQGDEFAANWRAQGQRALELPLAPFGHFDLILELAREASELTRTTAALAQGRL